VFNDIKTSLEHETLYEIGSTKMEDIKINCLITNMGGLLLLTLNLFASFVAYKALIFTVPSSIIAYLVWTHMDLKEIDEERRLSYN